MKRPLLFFLFDLDGTLVDSAPGICWAATEAMKSVMPGAPVPDFKEYIGPPIIDIFRRALPSVEEPVLKALCAAYRTRYDETGWCRTVPYPGVLETLGLLQQAGILLSVVTNKPRLPTQRILEEFGMTSRFAQILARDSRGIPFPDKAAMVAHLLTVTGADATRGALVGDSVDDAQAAASSGLAFYAVNYGYGRVADLLPEHALATLNSFPELTQHCRLHPEALLNTNHS